MGDEKQRDGIDRLLDLMEATNATIKIVAADTEGTREAVHVIRERMVGFEKRLDTLERADSRHMEWRRTASDADAKASSDQAAIVIAVEETRGFAKEALDVAKNSNAQVREAAEAARQAYEAARLSFQTASKGLMTIASVKTNQESQKTTLMNIEKEETKKPKVPVLLASMLNLTIGLVYLILELLHRMGH